jgi:hypothetical protein
MLGGLIGVALVALFIPLALWFAFAATYLWEWFIVPVFNAPRLTILEMWGIFLTVNAIHPLPPQKYDKEIEKAALFNVVAGPPLSLAVGYIIKFVLMA